jgi:hypothetical protein
MACQGVLGEGEAMTGNWMGVVVVGCFLEVLVIGRAWDADITEIRTYTKFSSPSPPLLMTLGKRGIRESNTGNPTGRSTDIHTSYFIYGDSILAHGNLCGRQHRKSESRTIQQQRHSQGRQTHGMSLNENSLCLPVLSRRNGGIIIVQAQPNSRGNTAQKLKPRSSLSGLLAVHGHNLDAVGLELQRRVQLQRRLLDDEGPHVVAEPVRVEVALPHVSRTHSATRLARP